MKPLVIWLFLALSTLLVACSSPPYMPARTALLADAPPGVARGQDQFKGARGTTLVEQWWKPATGTPRAAVAIVHGLKDHGGRYRELAERLVLDRGCAVYAIDLRGHAHSEGVRVDVEDFDDYLTDTDVFLGRVRWHEPGLPVFLFGHSMGGAITTLYTIKKHPDLAGLILSGAALEVGVSGVTVFGTKLIAGVSPDSGIFNLSLGDFSRDPEVVRQGEQDPLIYQDGAPARTAKELLNAIDNIGDHMEDVTVPLLILHGSADRVTPPQGSKDLYVRAKSKDKTLKIYDGFFHDLLHEPEKQRVVGDISAWIGQHEGRGALSPVGFDAGRRQEVLTSR